jgi:protein-S-isoprenylcysteine O-methyltransferase Ste14
MKKRIKINGVIIFIAVLLMVAFPAIFLRQKYIGPNEELAEVFGIALIMLGQILRVSARGYKSEHSPKGQALIQTGPYKLVRNPMYLGILLIGTGMILVLFQWWVLAIFLVIFSVRYFVLILIEEKKLAAMFPQYSSYQRKVPRILPSWNILWDEDIRGYLPMRITWIKKEIGPILWILLATLFLETWEDIKEEGLKVYLRESALIVATIILFFCLVLYLSKRTAVNNKDDANKSGIDL